MYTWIFVILASEIIYFAVLLVPRNIKQTTACVAHSITQLPPICIIQSPTNTLQLCRSGSKEFHSQLRFQRLSSASNFIGNSFKLHAHRNYRRARIQDACWRDPLIRPVLFFSFSAGAYAPRIDITDLIGRLPSLSAAWVA